MEASSQLKVVPTSLTTVLSLLKSYLQEQYKERLDDVVLFGSYARRENSSSSDVDVLIVLQDPVNTSTEIDRTSQFIAQLCLDHNLLISRFFLSKSRYETEDSPLLRNIRSEGILV